MATCNEDTSSGLEAIRKRSELASKLLLQAQKLRLGRNVGGVQRIERKIKAENRFLDSILSGCTALRDTHLSSTNLIHIQSVLEIALETQGLVAMQQCFTLVPGLGITPVNVQVDVVGAGGGRWVRVFCRKRSALHRRWLGDGQFGDKSVGDIAAEYVEAGKQNLHKFQPPKVSFVFFDGVTESVSGVLECNGIQVVGPVYPDKFTDDSPSTDHVMSLVRAAATEKERECTREGEREGAEEREFPCDSRGIVRRPPARLDPMLNDCERVNLDVSSMLAWVSSLTHGGEIYTLQDRILNEQAEQERQSPLWPQLQRTTRGKKLIACRTAVDGFSDIVGTVGGEQEKARARSLLAVVEVVDDCPSSRAVALSVSHRITPRAKIVFGSGDTLCALTLTANGGFVRAARHQGVHFEVCVHPSRALTEAKQQSPVPDNT